MNSRFFDTSGRATGSAASTSLDDLVDEAEDSHHSNGQNDLNDDEDELEVYMATIEKESKKQIKKAKLDLKADLDSDAEEVDEFKNVDEPGVEDLKADVQAAIAGVNAPANKTIKRLNQLSNRQVIRIPFKKDFYQEVPELTKMTKEEVEEYRLSLENIKIVGKHCPKPIMCWAHCGLSKRVMEVLKKLNYLTPTPIQAQAIPAIMSGRDVIGIAKTGCGKTLSFLLPMFRHILAQPKLEKGDGPIAVIMTPTRELATQICDDAQKFTKILGLRVVPVYGGPNISEQIGLLKPGAEIVVCTPGRMIEILTVNNGRVTNMDRCTFIVLDEADRLFDMGFEKQIRSIVDLARPDRQLVMFSATFPKILEANARKLLSDPVMIQVGGRSVVCKDVKQNVEVIEEDDKFLRLVPILQQHVDNQSSAIVFVSKQTKADSLLEDLMQAYDSNCLALHGGIDKDDRISNFSSFKRGDTKVLVATSVAARGLDVKNCICVVNYDCPNHYEDYVHRCGRTGRAGNTGYSFTFITPDQGQMAPDIIKALELSDNPVPENLRNLWEDFKTEAERLGKKIWSSSGFSGRGFKFDESETQMVTERKKYQKKSLGMQNSSDEDDETAEPTGDVDTATLESEIRSLAGSKREIDKPVIKMIRARDESRKTPCPSIVATEKSEASSSDAISKLDLVRQRAAMLCKTKGIEPVIPEVLPVKTTPDSKRNPRQADAVASSSGDSTKHMSATSNSGRRMELEMVINDYHQQVRRRLTSKETLAKVSELCEVGITVRGQFCAPGDRANERKLYLAIEGTLQVNLEQAHKELLLVVKDEYNRINAQQASRGKFKIV